MTLQSMLQKQQFATEKAELEQHYQDLGLQQWQYGYDAGKHAAGQSSGLELGYESGWKEAAKLNLDVGYNNGFADGATIALTGDNFIVVDKKNPRNLTSALDKDNLLLKLPQHAYQLFRDDPLNNLYGKNANWIESPDHLYVNLGQFQSRAREYRAATEKVRAWDEEAAEIIDNQFELLLDSGMDPDRAADYANAAPRDMMDPLEKSVVTASKGVKGKVIKPRTSKPDQISITATQKKPHELIRSVINPEPLNKYLKPPKLTRAAPVLLDNK